MASNECTVLVSFDLQQDKIDLAVSEIERLVATVTAEETDCHRIVTMRNADDPAKIMLVEKWASREAYEGPHMKTAHIQKFIGLANDFLTGPPDITFWTDANQR